jgi:iron complex outermembrane receptor protein
MGGSLKITPQLIAKLNLSSGFRAPNIAELASNGVHEGTFRYETGNSGLKSEVSYQIDGGIEFSSHYITFELSVFNNAIDNYIFSQKLVSTNGNDSLIMAEDNLYSAFHFVQGNAVLTGGELNLDIHPHPLDWLHIENSFSYVRGIQLNQPDSLKYLPLMPHPRWNSEVRAQFKKLNKVFSNFYLKLELEHNLKQENYFSAYDTETATNAYTLLNFGTGFDLLSKIGKTIFKFILNINNLADIAYQNHLSRLKYAPENIASGRSGVYNMGRNIGIKLIFPFEISKTK